MRNAPKPPALMPAAARLLYICLSVISLYLLAAAVYAGGEPCDILRRDNAFELLRSAYLASVLAFGGALVLDLDVRRANRR